MSSHKRPLSKKQIGILWMTIPFLALALVLALYAVSSFTLTAAVGEGATEAGGFSFPRILLGIFGFLSMLGAVVGIPVGLYFFSRVEPHEVSNLARHAAYEGLSEDQVEYIAKWSWSAFFLHWIWTLCNRGVRFWTLGFFAPIIQQYMWIKVAMHGRRMTWESGKWQSFKRFRRRQTILAWVAWIWAVAGLIFFIYVFTVFPKSLINFMFSRSLSTGSNIERSVSTSDDRSEALQSALCQGLEDLDEDGLIDKYESSLNADPKLKDTDGDGFTDGEELESGYDPGGPGTMTEKQKALYPIHQTRAERCL